MHKAMKNIGQELKRDNNYYQTSTKDKDRYWQCCGSGFNWVPDPGPSRRTKMTYKIAKKLINFIV
jgi:hypothetical protein